MKKLMKNKKGFTIVELVIVIAVIGILAGVLIPTFAGIVDKANGSSAQQEAKSALSVVLAMSSNATLNEGTKFVIDINGDDNSSTDNIPDCAFEYRGAKLVSDSSFKVKDGVVTEGNITLVAAKSNTDNNKEAKYDIVVSSKAITETGSSESKTIKFTKIVADIINAYTTDETTEITLSSVAANDYYTFTVEGKDIRVYVSSDLATNIVVFSAK